MLFHTDRIKTLPDLKPILITIDPERDTPEALAAYVKGKHLATVFLVLTGGQIMNSIASKSSRVLPCPIFCFIGNLII